MVEICTPRTVGRLLYLSSSSPELLQSVDSSLSSLSLLSSVDEPMSQKVPFSGTQKPDCRYFLVIIQFSASISMISVGRTIPYMYRLPSSPNLALAYSLHGDMPPGAVLVLESCSRSIVASLPVGLRPSGVACFGRMTTPHHRFAFP